MGSVKDLTILRKASMDHKGLGIFDFSDRYSIFDWGEMPDNIQDKGTAIAVLGAYFFEKLEETGIKTHYKGLIEDKIPKRTHELKKPSRSMLVDLFRVLKPEYSAGFYDYSAFKHMHGNFLVPLEIIDRNSLPEGSSVFRRLSDGELSLQDLDLKKWTKYLILRKGL